MFTGEKSTVFCVLNLSVGRLWRGENPYIPNHIMARACDAVGVKKIRMHDIRHSHASMLVERGFSPLLIAERLGHERVQTTMETYSNLYPNKQIEVAMQLDGLTTDD